MCLHCCSVKERLAELERSLEEARAEAELQAAHHEQERVQMRARAVQQEQESAQMGARAAQDREEEEARLKVRE